MDFENDRSGQVNEAQTVSLPTLGCSALLFLRRVAGSARRDEAGLIEDFFSARGLNELGKVASEGRFGCFVGEEMELARIRILAVVDEGTGRSDAADGDGFDA